jgi:hypothetical protein
MAEPGDLLGAMRAAEARSEQERLEQVPDAKLAELLSRRGYRIEKPRPIEPRVSIPAKPGYVYRCAVVCCTHFGSKDQQLTHLREFVTYAESIGVEDFWHAGDAVNGSDHMHLDMPYQNFKHGSSAQANYMAEVLPKPKSGRWLYILGNHEESFIKGDGFDVGDHVAERRPDLEYLGRRAASVQIGPIRMYIMHGGGGNAYARSYKLQKRIEQFSDETRPHVLLMGNYHTACHLPQYQNCEGFLLGCFQRQTPFEKGLGLNPVIGGLILEMEVGNKRPRSVRPEWRLYRPLPKDDY